MRKLRGPVLLVWIICAIEIIITISFTVMFVSAENSSGRLLDVAFIIISALIAMALPIPAALIITRQPRNVIGWLFMIPVVTAIASSWVNRYLAGFQTAPPADFFHLLLVLFDEVAWMPLIFPLMVVPLVFPTGRPPSRRWNWVVYLAAALCLTFFFFAVFSDYYRGEDFPWALKNPIGFLSDASSDAFAVLWVLMLSAYAISTLISVIFRYRNSTEVERKQIKWLLYGFAIYVLVFLPGIIINIDDQVSVLDDLSNILTVLSIVTIPTTVTIAILRYHLFEIDVIIRLTLVYALVTALLALVYITGIIAMQAGFRAVTGQNSDIAVLVTTLAITALFNPVRRSVQELIDRRFYRQKYDAVQAVAEFASAARGSSDLDSLTGMLIETVSKTLQPTHVGLYMRTAGKSESADPRL